MCVCVCVYGVRVWGVCGGVVGCGGGVRVVGGVVVHGFAGRLVVDISV